MCGIAGCVGPAAVPDELLVRMSAAIAHRGPDDDGVWCEPGVGFAHRRLSIIDLSALGHQPMVSSCGRYVIVFNGEIYNYIELRDELMQAGESFASHSDTEVLLVAFRRWGRAVLDRLNGMWAFAIWDRVERRLFASRDRFGKKPFYYSEIPGGMLFASEIKAILATGLIEPRVNPSAVADFAAERVTDHEVSTFFEGVFQLLPGSWLQWRGGSIEVGKYWSLDLHDEGRAFRCEEVRELLEDAVRIRLRADTPVGALLSGGLDSSAVTCLAAARSGSAIHTFTTLDAVPVEEAAGVDRVAAKYPNVIVHRDVMSTEDFLSELDRCIWHQEEPFADGSMVAHFRLMGIAREAGVKVLLTGQGADEVFAGYPGYLTIQLAGFLASGRFGEFRRKLKEIKATGQPVSLASVAGYALPSSVTRAVRARRSIGATDWLIPECRHVSPRVRDGYNVPRNGDALNAALLESIECRTLPGFLHYEDRNSMAFGVETRLPFLDYRLVSAVLPLSSERKTQGGLTKSLLRDALRGSVPDSIVARSAKTGYPAPLSRWLREAGPDVWNSWMDSVHGCPLIRSDRWHAHYARFIAGDDQGVAPTWRGLTLALWYRRFIARAAA
jgi:asparagine synthase (glutamine-hydrolysing)